MKASPSRKPIFILDFRHEGLPKEYPASMPQIHKNPIALSQQEIYSVIAFLQKMSGEPISVKVEDVINIGKEGAVKVASLTVNGAH